ncbi:MAG: crotonase/enoyl-CoA hydratase family protein [Actinomycetota bacterium]
MTVRIEDDGGIRVVTIDRPERRNAVDRPAAEALEAAFRDFDADDALDVAVLTGAEGTFCAGADLHAVGSGDGNRVTIEEPDGIVGTHGPMGPTRLLLTKPVIAAVEGHAVAGGLELAVWCDLRVVADDAILGVFCRRWGVPLIDGGTVRLPRLIGHSHALDLILTGRPVGADEALRMGLANRVAPAGEALATAVELARSLRAFPQGCLRSDRLSSYEQWDEPVGAALANETVLGRRVIDSGETAEGARRFSDGAGRGGSFSG